MSKKSWSKDEYFRIGLDELEGFDLPSFIVERYCESRRIAVTGLIQSSFVDVMRGLPMFQEVTRECRQEHEKYADELLRMLGVERKIFPVLSEALAPVGTLLN